METRDFDAPEHHEGFNARLRSIESIIEKAMQKHNNSLTLNIFLSPIGQHIERTKDAHVWMGKDDKMECQNIGDENKSDTSVTSELLEEAVSECKNQGYIWGNAAYSVPFCVCRDVYSMENNSAFFERLLAECGICIPEGTINNSLCRHPWMRYHIDRWEENGAKERVLRLRDAFREQMGLLLIPAKMIA